MVRSAAASRTVVGVTSVGSGIGQAVVDSLLDSAVPVTVVGFEARSLARGQYDCDVAFQSPLASSPEFIPFILDCCAREGVTLLIPGSDFEAVALAEQRDALSSQGVSTVVGPAEVVRLCRDKFAIAQHVRPQGGAFVETWKLTDVLEGASPLSYPVVIKPRAGSGSVGVQVAFSADDLRAAVATESGEGVVVQPFLADREWVRESETLARIEKRLRRSRQPVQEREVSVQFFLGLGGEELGSFASLNSLKAGIPMVIEPFEEEGVLDAARTVLRVLRPLGLIGPVNIQGRVTEAGAVFFEVNPRFTGITHVRHLMGYREVEAAVRLWCLGDPPEVIRRVLAPTSSWVGLRQTADTVVPRRTTARFASPAGFSRLPVPLESVLVTGATGFLGHELMTALLDRDLAKEVVAPTRDPQAAAAAWVGHPHARRVRWVEWDLITPPPVELEGAWSAVVHVAAVRPGPSTLADAFFAVNVRSTQTLVELVRRQKVPRLVYISSHSVYGTHQPRPWREETTGLRPETLYAASKAAGEAVVETLRGARSSWAILRLAGLYRLAANSRRGELVHSFAEAASAGQPLEVYGGGERERDLLHVRDAVEVVLAQLCAPLGRWNHVVNAGSGAPTRVRYVAEVCADAAWRLVGLDVQVMYRDLERDYPSFGVAIDRARERLDWRPRVSLEQGIEERVAAFAQESAGALPLPGT